MMSSPLADTDSCISSVVVRSLLVSAAVTEHSWLNICLFTLYQLLHMNNRHTVFDYLSNLSNFSPG